MKKLFILNAERLLIFKNFIFIVTFFLGLFIFKINNPKYYYCIGVLFFTSIIWFHLHKKHLFDSQKHILIQLLSDVTLENILILYSGGLESPLISLLILDLFLGAYVLSKKQLFILSLFAAISYSFISTLSYLNFLPSFLIVEMNVIPSPDVYFFYVIFMRTFIFLMMGYLASHLSSRILYQEAQIKQMHNLTEKILFQIGSGLISVDINDTIIYANKAACGLFDKKKEELLGKKWQELFVNNSSNEEFISFISKAYSNEGMEIKLTNPGKDEIFLSITFSEVKDEHDKTIGKTIVFRNLTLFKEMERLKVEQKKLKTLGELSGMLAHEIKNPLASICGSIEVLRENGSFSDIKSKKLVDVVFKETERLQRILNEFLTFSEGSTIKKEKLDIKHLLDEIILVLENHSEIGNGKELKFKYDDSQNYYALLDEDQFKQMIYNLVINAAQAIENTGFICISLSKKFYAEKHYIQIEVEDSGKGIPDENKKNIFKPFFSTRTKGMGLGLNVCTKISQNHGWDISLRDRKQGGTIFRILIQQ